MGSGNRPFFFSLAIFVALNSACSTGEEKEPLPAESSTTTQALPSPSPLANPLNLRPYKEKPCDLVTDQQVTQLGFEVKSPIIEVDTSFCRIDMYRVKTSNFASFELYPSARPSTYARNHIEGLEPISVRGYPASISRADNIDTQHIRSCALLIDVAESQGIRVNYQVGAGDPNDPCVPATQAAEFIVDNLTA
jgi:hypothetical protein